MDVVLATTNQGKVKEFNQVLSLSGLNLLSQSSFHVSAVEETGATFVENALIKARHAALETGLPAIADDSGLVVDHLKGLPGIHSARYVEGGTDTDRNNKLLAAMQGVPEIERVAQFYCVIVFVRYATDPMPIIGEGQLRGRILEVPEGQQGFGYDPIFYVPELNCSLANIALEEKGRISHRGQALSRWIQRFKTSVRRLEG